MRMINSFIFLAVLTLFSGCSIAQTGSQSDPDQQVLDQLKAAGSDLSKPHKIEFFLYFPSEEKANNAAAQLRKEGLTVEVRTAAIGADWLCLGTKEMVPKHSELVRLRNVFERIAKNLNGEYDGWGSPVVK